MTQYSKSFLCWYEALRENARVNGLEWVISSDPDGHFASYNRGLTPEEEFAELETLAQWRGCGCGGGG